MALSAMSAYLPEERQEEMMKIAVVVMLAALVGACSTPKVSGNAQGGIMGAYGPEKTFNAAQGHCRQYGKDAKITQIVPDAEGSATFSCI